MGHKYVGLIDVNTTQTNHDLMKMNDDHAMLVVMIRITSWTSVCTA